MVGRIIETDACVAEGTAWLAAHEPRFAEALAQTGTPPLRRRADGYPALLQAIVSQQLSVAAAKGIQARLDAAGAGTPDGLMALSDETLRACGLSRPKIRYARALAQSGLDYLALREAPNDAALDTLTALPGIGRWTAEIYLLFALGRADVFAPADLALQEAARVLFELDARPAPKPFAQMAEAWSPWRGVAARLLWAYYRVAKQREGVT